LANATCPEPAGTGSIPPKAQAEALVLQGLNEIQSGFLDQARSCLDQALEAAPDMPDVHFGLGLLEEESGDSELARHHYQQAIEHDPRHARAQTNLGLLLKLAGDLGQAEGHFRAAISSDPALPEAQVNLANLLQQTGRAGEAEAAYRQALTLEPALAEAHQNLSGVLLWQNRIPEALQFALKARQFAPDSAATHNTLGAVYKATQQTGKAIDCFQRAVDATHDNAVYHANLAGALVDARRLDDAREQFAKAIELDAELPDAHYGLGMLQLLEGDFADGWKNYEWRWRSAQKNRRHQNTPEWDGTSAPGRTLLVHCEQGLGDSIQFVRYLPLLTAQVGTLILECPPEARALFESIPGLAKVVTAYDPTPKHDLQIPLLSLPRVTGTLPSQVPYLGVSQQSPALGLPPGKLKVGIAWAGNPKHRNDAFRSMQWLDCQALLASDCARFVSLQLNAPADAAAALGQADNATDAAAHCTDLAATAAIIGQLDLVISVDTATAHLAGALGKPVWLLLPFAGEWRWLHDRTDSPWYPTMRIFRQPTPGDWRTVLSQVLSALRVESAAGNLAGLEGEGLRLKRSGQFEEARLVFEKIVELFPSRAEAFSNLGNILMALGKSAGALSQHEQARQLAPDSPGIAFNQSHALLKTGDFANGWAAYENRLLMPNYDSLRSRLDKPRWNGESLEGKTVLIWAEQGFGDTIQFARYLPMVAQRGGRVLFECQPELAPLMRRIDGIDEVIPRSERPPAHDLQCPLLSLPQVFGTGIDSIPSNVLIEPAKAATGISLPSRSSSRWNVGLVWRGSRRTQQPELREVPPEALAKLTSSVDAQFFSLQKETTPSERSQLGPVTRLELLISNFTATALLLQQLDLVITIDTAVAHLAGVLRRPVWLLLPFAGEWRWLENRTDSPWYPTLRIFRQPEPGDWASVIADVTAALEQQPSPEVARHLAKAAEFQEKNQLSQAVEQYQLAIGLQPDNAKNHHALGLLFSELGQAEQALGPYRRAIELQPDCADAHFNCGNAHYALGQASDAKSAFQRATELDPELAAAHFNLGQVAQDEGDFLTAAQAYKRAVDLDGDYTDAMVNLGLTLRDLGETALAEECFGHILHGKPGQPMAGVNMAKLQLERDDPAAAEATCRSVLGEHPKHPETLLNLGVALQAQNRVVDAVAAFKKFTALEPQNPDGPFNLAIAELAAGNWTDGWQHYEARWQTDNPLFAPRHPGIPRWNGEPLAGKTLLLFAEQGFGDTLQFCRYASNLAATGAIIVIECQAGLRALLQTLPGVSQVFEPGEPVPPTDFTLPMLSAPLAFGTTPETVPNGENGRYLFAEPAGVVPDVGALKIGVVWAGRSRSWADNRSLPAKLLSGLLGKCSEFAWFNLQLEPSDEARRIIDSTACVTDLSPHISDFASTASLIESMDLVVTVDTAVVHLAGALGKPTWVLLPFAADWRWLLDREDTPWYPNTKLFRQRVAGDWPEVIDRVANELQRLAKR